MTAAWLDWRRLWRGLRAKPALHPALAAHQAAFADFDHKRDLAEIDFVALDTELTGFHPKRDAIVAIGAVKIKTLRINPAEAFFTLVRPPGGVSRSSTLIHRLTEQALADAPPIEEALAKFLAYCGNAVLVGHHVDLDLAFLNAAAASHFGGELAAPCIDTIRLAQIYEEKHLEQRGLAGTAEHVGFNLSGLARRYGLPMFKEHDAYNDALQTAYLFLYLVKKLGRGRPLSMASLWRAGRMWWFG